MQNKLKGPQKVVLRCISNLVDDFEDYLKEEGILEPDRNYRFDEIATLLHKEGWINENNSMKNFDYKQYLAEGWLFKEAQPKQATTADLKGFATKDATLSREKRAQKGNWKGSVGKYVEDHRAEIDDAAQNGNLRAYIQATMKPALGPEAQEYLESLLSGYASNRQLHQTLYNIMLKGSGLGLHEEEQGETGGGDTSRSWTIDNIGKHIPSRFGEKIWDFYVEVSNRMGPEERTRIGKEIEGPSYVDDGYSLDILGISGGGAGEPLMALILLYQKGYLTSSEKSKLRGLLLNLNKYFRSYGLPALSLNMELTDKVLDLQEEENGIEGKNGQFSGDSAFDPYKLSDQDLQSYLSKPVSEFAALCHQIEDDENTGPGGGCYNVVSRILELYGIPQNVLDEATENVYDRITNAEYDHNYYDNPNDSREPLKDWLEALFDDDSWWDAD